MSDPTSVGEASVWRSAFDAFLVGRHTLCVSTEILLEYEEEFQQFWGDAVAANLLGTLLTASNVSLKPVFYNFSLVTQDADDNKFTDIYLAANADYLVSNDTALLALNTMAYPAIEVILHGGYCFTIAPAASWAPAASVIL
jgi:putative PIN family toxin of toxin-antitoxin system